jgi:hypothetical protein
MRTPFLLLLLIIVWACEKHDSEFSHDSKYPTIYRNLPGTELFQAKNSYYQKNPHIRSTLNQFGFCDIDHDGRTIENPTLSGPLNREEAAELAFSFLVNNKTFTGITGTEVPFESIKTSNSAHGEGVYWHFKTETQKIDTIEVLFTKIILHSLYREIQSCYGNWYENVYIPAVFNFSSSKSKEILNGKIVAHTTIGGDIYHVKISAADLNNSKLRVVVYPKIFSDRTELRVTWEINIPLPVNYKIYVDVMTGEIIAQEPTLIS